MDDYEIQQYMIECDQPDVPGERWAVRDTGMQITMSRHDTREQAVEACEKLRNPPPAPAPRTLIGWDREGRNMYAEDPYPSETQR